MEVLAQAASDGLVTQRINTGTRAIAAIPTRM